MAFHPFHWFRKHQKAFFAVLTIVCMIVFILQFGAGDITGRFMSWFGAGKNKGQLVAKVYGDKVYQNDLAEQLRRRNLANQFLLQSVQDGQRLADSEIGKDQTQLSPIVTGARGRVSRLATQAQIAQLLAQQGQTDPRYIQELHFAALQTAAEMRSLLNQGTPQGKLKPEESKAVSDALSQATLIAWQTDPRRSRGGFYFGGGTSYEDLLDFKIWLKQADKMGLVFVEEDIRKLVNHEAFGRDVIKKKFEDDDAVKRYLQLVSRSQRPVTASELLEALEDEFKVVLAQEIILGQGPGIRAYQSNLIQPPTAPTPAEFESYYREQRTVLDVAFLEVPTSHYESQVNNQPSDGELRDLYNQGKSRVPSPDSGEPAFKVPGRSKLQYLKIEPDAPYYREGAWIRLGASNMLPEAGSRGFGTTPVAWLYPETGRPGRASNTAALVGRFGAVDALGCGFGPAVCSVALECSATNRLRDPLEEHYRLHYPRLMDQRRKHLLQVTVAGDKGPTFLSNPGDKEDRFMHNLIGKVWSKEGKDFQPIAWHTGRVFLATYTCPGQSMAPLILAAASVGPTTYLAEDRYAQYYENRYNIAKGVVGVVGALPSPGGGIADAFLLAAATFPVDPYNRELDIWLTSRSLVADEQRRLVKQEIDDFTEGMKAAAAKPDDARKFVADVNAGKEVKIGKRTVILGGLKGAVRGPSNLVSSWEAETDPSLRELRDAYVRNNGKEVLFQFGHIADPRFAPLFTVLPVTIEDEEVRKRQIPPLPPLTPETPRYRYWRSDETADTEQSFEDARSQVVQYWRQREARKKARAEADSLLANVKGANLPERNGTLDYLRGLSASKGLGGVVDIPDVSRQPKLDPRHGQIPYQPDPAKIRYPRDNFVDVLMRLEKAGDAIVLSDRGEAKFYVAVLLSRKLPDMNDFLKAYGGADPTAYGLWAMDMQDRTEAFRKKVMEQLRREASPDSVDAGGRWNLPENVTKKETEEAP
jgi:hypothetical protein